MKNALLNVLKTDAPLVSLHNISYTDKTRKILYDIEFSVSSGKITTVIGPNGAGKTTLLKIILGFLTPTGGRVIKQPYLTVGYMPQKILFHALMPLRVLDFFSLMTNDRTLIDKGLSRFSIKKLSDRQMHHLSGGELQRVLLMQATLNRPRLLVLDEPAQGADLTAQNELYQYIDDIRFETGCGVLLVSHDLYSVMAKSDEVLCLNHHICCQGHPEDIQKHPEYLGLFGGHLSHLAPYHHRHDHTHQE